MSYGPMQDLSPDEPENGGPNPLNPNLWFRLTEKELAKLGLDHDAEVGDFLHAALLAEVTSVRKDRGPDGEPGVCIELEIKALGLHDEDHEDMDMAPMGASVGDTLFGG